MTPPIDNYCLPDPPDDVPTIPPGVECLPPTADCPPPVPCPEAAPVTTTELLDSAVVPPEEGGYVTVGVADSSIYFVGSCVLLIGANGKRGVYHIAAVGTNLLDLEWYDDYYDSGPDGNFTAPVNMIFLPVCPFNTAELDDVGYPGY